MHLLFPSFDGIDRIINPIREDARIPLRRQLRRLPLPSAIRAPQNRQKRGTRVTKCGLGILGAPKCSKVTLERLERFGR